MVGLSSGAVRGSRLLNLILVFRFRTGLSRMMLTMMGSRMSGISRAMTVSGSLRLILGWLNRSQGRETARRGGFNFRHFNRSTSGARVIERLAERLVAQGAEPEVIDADSPRGIQIAETHDIMGRPAVMVVSNDGTPVQVWQGEDRLPSPSELAYYARQ